MEESSTACRRVGETTLTFAMLIAMAPYLSHSSHSMRDKRGNSTQRAFAGASNTTEKSDGKHLNIRVDTVDRFQGAESPIVIVSMVRSAPIAKGAGEAIEEVVQ